MLLAGIPSLRRRPGAPDTRGFSCGGVENRAQLLPANLGSQARAVFACWGESPILVCWDEVQRSAQIKKLTARSTSFTAHNGVPFDPTGFSGIQMENTAPRGWWWLRTPVSGRGAGQ